MPDAPAGDALASAQMKMARWAPRYAAAEYMGDVSALVSAARAEERERCERLAAKYDLGLAQAIRDGLQARSPSSGTEAPS